MFSPIFVLFYLEQKKNGLRMAKQIFQPALGHARTLNGQALKSKTKKPIHFVRFLKLVLTSLV